MTPPANIEIDFLIDTEPVRHLVCSVRAGERPVGAYHVVLSGRDVAVIIPPSQQGPVVTIHDVERLVPASIRLDDRAWAGKAATAAVRRYLGLPRSKVA